jgi:hypothetical protein
MDIDEAISWKRFDASKKDPHFEKILNDRKEYYLRSYGIPRSEKAAVECEMAKHNEAYGAGKRDDLDDIVAINIFKPSEFDDIIENDKALNELNRWLVQIRFKWRSGSSALARLIRSHFEGGRSTTIDSDRAPLLLDNLVKICGRWAAIEVEASKNMDNGITSMRFAIRRKQADFGVLIVPWLALGPGRVYEGNALGRIDDEFHQQTNPSEGPIYRLALVQKIDICRMLLSESQQ